MESKDRSDQKEPLDLCQKGFLADGAIMKQVTYLGSDCTNTQSGLSPVRNGEKRFL